MPAVHASCAISPKLSCSPGWAWPTGFGGPVLECWLACRLYQGTLGCVPFSLGPPKRCHLSDLGKLTRPPPLHFGVTAQQAERTDVWPEGVMRWRRSVAGVCSLAPFPGSPARVGGRPCRCPLQARAGAGSPSQPLASRRSPRLLPANPTWLPRISVIMRILSAFVNPGGDSPDMRLLCGWARRENAAPVPHW